MKVAGRRVRGTVDGEGSKGGGRATGNGKDELELGVVEVPGQLAAREDAP